MSNDDSARSRLGPGLKAALDFGPLLLFVVAYFRPTLFGALLASFLPQSLLSGDHAGLFTATAVFIPATLIALGVSYAKMRRVAIMPLVTAVIVVVFGGLTLALHNETFIKIKPTIVYALFGVVLSGGLCFGKPLLGAVFDSVFHLTDAGWKKLTLRWALFFFFMAALNELVWRTQSTDVWVAFKAFGALPLTLVYGALQYPLLQKYAAENSASTESPRR